MKHAAGIAVSLLLVLTGCTTASLRTSGGGNAPAPELSAEDRQFARALAHYGQALLYQGEVGRFSDEALEQFTAAVKADPETHRLASRVALAYLVRNRTDDAVAILEESCARLPESIQARVDLALVCQMANRMPAAAKHYEIAVGMDPGRDGLYVELARALFEDKQDDRAINAVRDGLRNGRKKDPVLVFCYRQALTFLGASETARAVPCFRAVLDFVEREKRPPLSARFYFLYGSACEQNGNYDEAEQVFEKCIVLHPEADAVLNYLAYMWAERGVKLDRALTYVQRALDRDESNAAYIDTLGWIYYRKREYALAVEHLRRAHDIMGDDPTIADHLGDALLAMRQADAAVAHWKTSYELDPKNERVANKLREHGVDPATLIPREEARKTE